MFGLTPKTLVILDTNALLLPAGGVDVFTLVQQAMQEPYTLATTDGVLEELQKLMVGKKRDSFAAKLGFIMVKQKGLKTLGGSSGRYVDDALVEAADPKKTVVVTQDKELIGRLRKKGVRVLRFQQGQLRFQS